MQRPTVSVVLPAYNRGRLVRRTLASLGRQTYRDWEVIVVDDGSRDDTASQAESAAQQDDATADRMHLVRLAKNCGANVARNEGIQRARGRYLAFLDSDDLWHPDKLRLQFAVAERALDRATHSLTYTGRVRIDAAGRVLATQDPGPVRRVRRNLRRFNAIGPLSSVMVSTDAARAVGGFDESLPACQDWDFFLRVAPHCRLVRLPDLLLAYVDAGADRISESPIRRFRGHAAVYRRHIQARVPRRDQYPFWRNVAEDLDDLGHHDWARRFISYQAMLRGHWGEAWATFVGRGPLGLREARYARYQERLGVHTTSAGELAWLKELVAEDVAES